MATTDAYLHLRGKIGRHLAGDKSLKRLRKRCFGTRRYELALIAIGHLHLRDDQTGTDPRFAEFARGADLLVLHMTVGVGAKSPLHAAPDVVGQLARDAKPARLILSHLDPANLEAAVAEVKKHYLGPLTVAADLQCTTLR